jgi:hypothetical protein
MWLLIPANYLLSMCCICIFTVIMPFCAKTAHVPFQHADNLFMCHILANRPGFPGIVPEIACLSRCPVFFFKCTGKYSKPELMDSLGLGLRLQCDFTTKMWSEIIHKFWSCHIFVWSKSLQIPPQPSWYYIFNGGGVQGNLSKSREIGHPVQGILCKGLASMLSFSHCAKRPTFLKPLLQWSNTLWCKGHTCGTTPGLKWHICFYCVI